MSFYGVSPVLFAGVSQVTASLGTNDPEIGTRMSAGDEDYLFVYNAGNSQAVPGQLLTASAVTNYSLTISSTTNLDVAVGVVKHATLTTGTYGWLLTKGFGPAKLTADSGCAAGQLLTVGGDGVWSVKSLSTAIPSEVYGKAMTATASAGVCDAYFKIF